MRSCSCSAEHGSAPAQCATCCQVTTQEIKVKAYAVIPGSSIFNLMLPDNTDGLAIKLYIRGRSTAMKQRPFWKVTSEPVRCSSLIKSSTRAVPEAGGAITRLTSIAEYRSMIVAPMFSARALSWPTNHRPVRYAAP
jgi:hypothetical protein